MVIGGYMIFEIFIFLIVIIVITLAVYIIFFPEKLIQRAYVRNVYSQKYFRNWGDLLDKNDIEEVYRLAIKEIMLEEFRRKNKRYPYYSFEPYESDMVKQFIKMLEDAMKSDDPTSDGRTVVERVIESALWKWKQNFYTDIDNKAKGLFDNAVKNFKGDLDAEVFIDEVVKRIRKKQLTGTK